MSGLQGAIVVNDPLTTLKARTLVTVVISPGAVQAAIDDAKCCDLISFNTDQGLHLGCKIAWAVLA